MAPINNIQQILRAKNTTGIRLKIGQTAKKNPWQSEYWATSHKIFANIAHFDLLEDPSPIFRREMA